MPSPVLPTNPVALLRQTTISDNNNRLLAFIEADYRLHFLPDLTLSWQFGINKTRADLERRTDSNAAWTNYSPDEKSGNRANISIASVNYNKQLKSINSRLTLNVMHRAEWLKSEFYSILTTLKNSQRHEALIGTINYVLARKYSLTLYLNADGTSLYNDKWGYFPAMSFRWNIGNEKFLSESSIISDLALRLAYRKSGGLNTNAPGEYTVSPWIHHESIKVLNAGIDYSLFNNKISGSVNYYVRNSKDLLVPLEVPYNTVLANFGSIGTRSLDFVVYAKPLNTENLNWQLSLNFAWMQNTVTSMNEFRILTGNIHGGVYSTIQMLYENNKMNSFRVMQQVYGNDETPIEGFYVDRDNSGTINNNDFYSYEQPDPKIAAGFSSDLKYKFWTLSVSGSVWYDNYVYNNISSLSYYENIISSPYYLRNISTGIYDSEFRRQQIYSDYYVENASFLKIEYLQLEYSIPSRKNRPGIGISAGMQNWFTITRYSGLEPEQPDGIEYFMYPRPRAIIFGLKLEV